MLGPGSIQFHDTWQPNVSWRRADRSWCGKAILVWRIRSPVRSTHSATRRSTGPMPTSPPAWLSGAGPLRLSEVSSTGLYLP
jgi:hypothetical protein